MNVAPAETRTYVRDEAVVFKKTNEKFGGLSNMARGFPLRVGAVHIPTTEALYQACRFPERPDIQRLIIAENSPMTAKMKAKRFLKDTREDWDHIRVQVMRWCLRVKLLQHWGKFGSILLTTGSREIVEESRRDDFWGAKLTLDATLVGRNVLGRILMELREQLKEAPHSLDVLNPLMISNFVLFEKAIPPLYRQGSQLNPIEPEPVQVRMSV
jgi:type I restriction enzyme S subunit